jgi:hypothetical protein
VFVPGIGGLNRISPGVHLRDVADDIAQCCVRQMRNVPASKQM